MSYFIFKNGDSRDYGLLEGTPMFPTTHEIVNIIDVEGRTVKPVAHTGTMENMTITAVLGMKSREDVRAAYGWLNGTGNLIFSDEIDKFYKVREIQLTPERLSQRFGKITIDFTVEPFAYAVEPTSVDLTAASSYTEVNNRGTVFSEPEFRFTPTAAQSFLLNVNGGVFRVDVPVALVNKEIVIDCAAQVTYYEDDNNNKVSINQLTYNNYPLLHTGMNYAKHDGGISSLICNVRERWL